MIDLVLAVGLEGEVIITDRESTNEDEEDVDTQQNHLPPAPHDPMHNPNLETSNSFEA